MCVCVYVCVCVCVKHKHKNKHKHKHNYTHTHTQVMIPTVKGMKAEGKPFKGVLFAGIMIKNGQIKTLEHNVRFGDPECQTVMMRLKSDLLNTLIMASEGRFRSANENQP